LYYILLKKEEKKKDDFEKRTGGQYEWSTQQVMDETKWRRTTWLWALFR
jgi:hypothetical protein